jgi:hypothetical protein
VSNRTVFHLAICLAAIPVSAGAQSTVQPIVAGEAKDHPGCYVYLKADGSRLLFQTKPIAARGNCPADFLPGNVVRFGADTYRLRIPSKRADCVITPQGLGRCQPGVIDDRPNPKPPATPPEQSAPPARPPQSEPAQPSLSTPPLPKGD